MHSYRKRVLSIFVVVALLFATNFAPLAFAKEVPDTLLITDLSNYSELALEDEDLVEKIWNELPCLVLDESFKQGTDNLKGLSKYVLQFRWNEPRGLPGLPGCVTGTFYDGPVYYYVDDGFPYTISKKAFILYPYDNPSYVQQTDHTFNALIFNAYRSAVNTIQVLPRLSSIIGLNQPIEFNWKVHGMNNFGEKGHTNLHCIIPKEPGTFARIYTNSSPEMLKEIDWIKHFGVDLISEPIRDYNPDGFYATIRADSKAIYYCRIHVSNGTSDALSRIFEVEVLDPRELSKSNETLSWDKEIYQINDRLILTFEDPAYDKDPNAIDTVEVRLWTDTDRGGLLLVLRETGESSGIFREIISFCPECSGAGLRVTEGDLVTAYMPSTGAIAYARIAGKVRPADRISITGISFIDEQANRLGKFDLLVNQEVNIQTNITNNQKKDQEMRLITQIKDSENITALIASKRIVVPALASLTINQPWIPTEAKLYSIEVFIWQDFENPSPLGQPQNLQGEPRESASCCRVGRLE